MDGKTLIWATLDSTCPNIAGGVVHMANLYSSHIQLDGDDDDDDDFNLSSMFWSEDYSMFNETE